MSRAKTKKFLEFKRLDNCFDKNNLNLIKKKINSADEIYLELASGRGEYTVYLAEKNPNTLCIAVDFRSNRLVWGAKIAKEKHLFNALFLRERIQNLPELFKIKKASKIWIVFPDPFERKKQEKHRLTNIRFLHIYKKISQKDCQINIKTDNKHLYEYTVKVLKQTKYKILNNTTDLLNDMQLQQLKDYEELILPTKYQKLALKKNKQIYYIKFAL
ncbi:MAG: tRNA (guanine-N(7)-)-methyltransferase [Patescibacteria group bacterium]|nr:MAG: tRNA (guanine-N(7)-)-methyltransferase [Patescibacteria group bacterium]